MGQYDVLKFLADSGQLHTRGEIADKIDRSKSTVGYGLKQLKKKGYVIKDGTQYKVDESITNSEIESLKPTSLSDAMEDTKRD